jgi:hypothetical protein
MPEEGDIAFEKKNLGGGKEGKWRVKGTALVLSQIPPTLFYL